MALSATDTADLHHWQDQLFSSFLVYCLPVSLIALLPCVFMAFKDGLPVVAAVDLACFGLLVVVTFSGNFTLRHRKIFVVALFYFLAIFLINSLGYLGPGIFYLFFITVLSALILPIRFAYLSVLINAALLSAFDLIIGFKLFHSALIQEYTIGKWIAFSANLIFASILVVLLIDQVFKGLQITIEKKTQVKERYLQIFNKSPLPMWLFDTLSCKFIDVNEAAIGLYGYSRAEFMKMAIIDIRYTESAAVSEETVRANRVSGEFYGGNSQHIKRNGEMIFVKIDSSLLHLDGRQVRLVQATDITIQVEHQLDLFNYNQQIKESEANLRAIFDSAVDGFVLLDSHGIIKAFNAKASAAMEFNKDQSVLQQGRSIFDYIANSRMAYFTGAMAKVYGGETIDYDGMIRSEGAITWIRYTITPVREEKRIIGACITGRDITERKFYLRSVEEQNRVFREISWMQSHLVRAPLARILGLLPMLSNEADESEKLQIITYLNYSANELDLIIRDITEKSTSVIQKYPEAGPQSDLSAS